MKLSIIQLALYLLNQNAYLKSILEDKDEDYPYLIYKYISRYNKLYGKNIIGLDKKVTKKIMKKGKVNKIVLEKVIAHAILFEDSNRITIESLPKY